MSDQHLTILPTQTVSDLLAAMQRLEAKLDALTEKANGGPAWLNRTEAAKLLGVSDRTLLKYEKDYGWITPRYDEHGRPKFRRDEVQALFERKKQGSK